MYLGYVLDRSASMQTCGYSVFNGLKQSIKDKISFAKEMNMNVKFCIHTFNHNVKRIDVPDDPAELTEEHYKLIREEIKPDGWTSLYDAIKQAIEYNRKSILEHASTETETDTSAETFMIIITDGEDNHSVTTLADIKSEIAKHVYEGTEYIYIGANINAKQSGTSLGINPQACMQFTPNPNHTLNVFNSLNNVIHRSVTGEDADGPQFRLGERQSSCTAADNSIYNSAGDTYLPTPKTPVPRLNFDAVLDNNKTDLFSKSPQVSIDQLLLSRDNTLPRLKRYTNYDVDDIFRNTQTQADSVDSEYNIITPPAPPARSPPSLTQTQTQPTLTRCKTV